jgi:hypothetical protein
MCSLRSLLSVLACLVAVNGKTGTTKPIDQDTAHALDTLDTWVVRQAKPVDQYKDTAVVRQAKPVDQYKDTVVVRQAKPVDQYKDTAVVRQAKPVDQYKDAPLRNVKTA